MLPFSLSFCAAGWRVSVLIVVLLVALSSAWAEPVSVVDDAGKRVWLAQPAQRIVTLTPHATELVYAAGAGQLLVATVDSSDFPPQAKSLPRVGDFERIDLERLLALRPDLIIGWQSSISPLLVERLATLGIPLFLSEPRRLEQIPENIARIAQLAGSAAEAAPSINELRRRIAGLVPPEGLPPLRAFYQVWPQPLMTLNGEHLISDALRRCGGNNVFSDLPALAAEVSVEALLQRRPEVILAGDSSGSGNPLGHWQRWPQLPAVRLGNLFEVNADLLQRPGPRFIDGAEALCRTLHRAHRQGP